MSFSWRGIFNKSDGHSAAHASGSGSKATLGPAIAGASNSNASAVGVNGNDRGRSGAPMLGAGSSAHAAGTGANGMPADTGGSSSGASGSVHPNGHAQHPAAPSGPALIEGEIAGPSGTSMVARLRVWEELERPGMPLLGFENFGNTCYANSVLQALYHCQPFRESILKHRDEVPRPLPAALQTSTSKAAPATNSTAQAQGSIPFALQDLFAQMTEQSIATVQAATASAAGANAAAPGTPMSGGFSAKRAFGGLSMGGLGGIPPIPTTPTQLSGGGFSMGSAINGAGLAAAAAAASAAPQLGSASGSHGDSAGGGKDGPSASTAKKAAVDQAAIKAFLAALRKENVMFDSTMHQDAHEMLNFVLNRVGEELVDGKSKTAGPDFSPASASVASGVDGNAQAQNTSEGQGKTCVHRLFEGKLTNETRCLTCETVSSRDESFLDLSIDIDQNSSVTSCLRQFSASETLRSRNKFFCDTCSGLQEAEKRMKVKQLPNVLALHLKRFKYEETVQKYIKLAYRVVFPMQLRLFNTSDVATNPDRLYTLFAIVVHIGAGLHHGHYIAIVKVGSRWVSFDDDTVETIDEIDIAKYFGDTPGTGSAYVLFYQADDLDREELGLQPLRTAAGGSSSSLSLPTNAVGAATGLFATPTTSGQGAEYPALPGALAAGSASHASGASATTHGRAPSSPGALHTPRPATADAIRDASSIGTFSALKAPTTPRARTPSPGDVHALGRLGVDTPSSTGTGATPSASVEGGTGTRSRMGTLLRHKRASRQSTLPVGLEAHFAGLDAEGSKVAKGGLAGAMDDTRLVHGAGSVSPAPAKTGRRSLVGRFGFGKSGQN